MGIHELFDGSVAQELSPIDHFKARWATKTTKQVEKELASMHKYVQRHSAHYAWHGANVPPGGIGDGDKIVALKEILRERASAEGGEA